VAAELSAHETRRLGLIVGVVSDTHLPRFGTQLPKRLIEGLQRAKVSAILHAGDLVTPLAIELLQEIAPVIAVRGNNDKSRDYDKPLPEETIAQFEEVRIGVVHGHAGKGRTTPDRAFNAFVGEPIAAIVFGHSHMPMIAKRDGVLLVNPGSPTDKRFNPRYSYATLEITGRKVTASMHYYLNREA
jgi:uncharacterized protein